MLENASKYERLAYFVNLYLEYDTPKRLYDMIQAEKEALKELKRPEFIWKNGQYD